MYFLDRVWTTPLRTVAVGAGIEVRLEDRFQYQLGSALYYAVSDRWDTEWPLAVAAGLRDHHPSHRRWSVRLLDQVLPDVGQPLLEPVRFDHLECDPVHSRRALV